MDDSLVTLPMLGQRPLPRYEGTGSVSVCCDIWSCRRDGYGAKEPFQKGIAEEGVHCKSNGPKAFMSMPS